MSECPIWEATNASVILSLSRSIVPYVFLILCMVLCGISNFSQIVESRLLKVFPRILLPLCSKRKVPLGFNFITACTVFNALEEIIKSLHPADVLGCSFTVAIHFPFSVRYLTSVRLILISQSPMSLGESAASSAFVKQKLKKLSFYFSTEKTPQNQLHDAFPHYFLHFFIVT